MTTFLSSQRMVWSGDTKVLCQVMHNIGKGLGDERFTWRILATEEEEVLATGHARTSKKAWQFISDHLATIRGEHRRERRQANNHTEEEQS